MKARHALPLAMAPMLALMLALMLVGATTADARRRAGLRSISVEVSPHELPSSLSAGCLLQVRQELSEGRRRNDGCAEDREAAGGALVRRRDRFGFVERRHVDLVSLRVVLGVAKRCRGWPLRSPERDVLGRTDAVVVGCRLRRYQGEVPLVMVDRRGRRHALLPAIHTDVDGRLELRFAEVDEALRALGRGGLGDYAAIELGVDAWAGRVDLDRLLRFRADWHLSWVSRGRGVPGLFAVAHPEHPGVDEARALAAEAAQARQQRDVVRVKAGELSVRGFVDRYPWSPYRREVEAGDGIPD